MFNLEPFAFYIRDNGGCQGIMVLILISSLPSHTVTQDAVSENLMMMQMSLGRRAYVSLRWCCFLGGLTGPSSQLGWTAQQSANLRREREEYVTYSHE